MGMKFCHDKLVFWAAYSEDLVILACTVLTQYCSVMNGEMDGRLDNS